MQTERLFYRDAYQKEFDGTVLECRRAKKGYEIRLDRREEDSPAIWER